MKQTRKSGGAFIGKGVHGDVFNAGKTRKLPTLFSFLQGKQITNIIVATSHGDVKIHDTADFVSKIGRLTNKIAKVLKEPAFYKTYSREDDYHKEIQANKKIVKGFGKHAYMLSIMPITGLYKESLYGAIITYVSGKKDYILFGNKCQQIHTLDVYKFLKDCLEELVVLHKMKYVHNDIKHANIIYCENRYKIIDFGSASSIKTKLIFGGSIENVNPLRLYIKGLPLFITEKYIKHVIANKISSNYLKSVEHLFTKIMSEAHDIAAKMSKEEIHRKYMFNFDVFQLGMTLNTLLDKFKLHSRDNDAIVERFASVSDPFYTAKDALAWVEAHFAARRR